jgi:hypothetical protein
MHGLALFGVGFFRVCCHGLFAEKQPKIIDEIGRALA